MEEVSPPCRVSLEIFFITDHGVMAQSTTKPPPYEDVLGCQAAFFELAESFDTKDWDRLAQCIAPTLYVDYRQVIGKLWESMPAEQFVTVASNPNFLGNRRIKTQHFIGTARWVKTSDDAITGYHQMRVAHQKYKDDELTEVLCKGHCHGKATVQYRRVDGVWKLAGMEPDIRWTEGEYDKIFQH